MNSAPPNNPCVAIACGGTGGHLFPGLAIAGQLEQRGCDVLLLISPKDIDQQAVQAALARRVPARCGAMDQPGNAGPEAGAPVEVFTLPAIGLQGRNYFSFAGSFVKSLFAARKIFRRRKPQAVLAMGGFTSAPPVLVAKDLGVKTFLHESNTIAGRANRFLARFVDEAFVGFPEAAAQLRAGKVTPTGTPVRPQFHARAAAECRVALGLDADRPTVLVVGGSQGAHGLNEMILSALPLLSGPASRLPSPVQWLHLAGANDFEKVKSAYAALGLRAVVRPFLAEMDLALGAATAAVSRAGASSLAEMSALRLPSLLVPLPTSADNHQFFNARAYAQSGAAQMLEQNDSTPEKVAARLGGLVGDESARSKMQAALAQWHAPESAAKIAEAILHASVAQTRPVKSSKIQSPSSRESASPKHPFVHRAGNLGAWFLVLLGSLRVGAGSLFYP